MSKAREKLMQIKRRLGNWETKKKQAMGRADAARVAYNHAKRIIEDELEELNGD